MKKLTLKKAEELKEKGYTQIASIVKSAFNTTYYHVNKIDDIIKNDGKWIPCGKYQHNSWHGPVGTIGGEIDWKKTTLTKNI